MKDYRDAGNPVTTVRALCSQGIDEVLLLDIAADAPHWDILEAVADECTVPLTFGGGLHALSDVRRAFCGGADKVFLPLHKRALIEDVGNRIGRQAVVVGVDVQGRPPHLYRGYEHRLLRVDREGSRQGLDPGLPETDHPLILEGGAGHVGHIAEAFRAGASAVALGTMLVFGDNNIVKIKKHLKAEGFAVRL